MKNTMEKSNGASANPFFSVIVPVYNVEKYIGECIDSILQQTFLDFELIIVNDGSIDSSLSIIGKYSDHRIVLINKENGGLSSARNQGIKLSSGKYIIHVDGDDFLSRDALQWYHDVLSITEYDVVISNFWKYDGREMEVVDAIIDDNHVFDGIYYLENFLFKGKGSNSVCNKAWKRSLYLDNNITHNINISMGEDGNASIKLLLNANLVSKLNKCTLYYRTTPNSMTQKTVINISDYYISYLDLIQYSKLIDNYVFINNKVEFLFYNYYMWVVLLTNKDIHNKYKGDKDYLLAKQRFVFDSKNVLKLPLDKRLKIVVGLYTFSPVLAEKILDIYRIVKP